MITISSNRIYKDNLDKSTLEYIDTTLNLFNQVKIKTYSLLCKGVKTKEIRRTVSKQFGINNYYEASTYQFAKGVYTSNRELRKDYIEDAKGQIKRVKKKLASKRRYLTFKEKLLESVISIHKASLNNEEIPELYTYPSMRENYFPQQNIYTVKKGDRIIEYIPYLFEVQYLKPQIKRIKSNIGNLKFKLHRLEQRLEKLETKEIRSVFGTKDLFEKQYTIDKYIANHKLWRKDFHSQRFKLFQVAGRKDATQGNFVFRYDGDNLEMKGFEKGKKTVINISDVDFPYRKKDLMKALNLPKNKRKAVAWSIEDHREYYLIKVSFSPIVNRDEFNYSKDNGVMSIDINVDHIAYTELDSNGNFLKNGVVDMHLSGSTGQNAKTIENAVCEIFKICKEKKKPLVKESLDLKASKRKLMYGNNEKNRKISSFAYNKIQTAIESRAVKDKVEVFNINPAYTSMLGKLKYMKTKGLSIHIAASYCIGRRGLELQEKLPTKLRDLTTATTYTGRNKQIYKAISGINHHVFYKDLDLVNVTSHKDLKCYLQSIT
ncbi:MAG: hypothetical protein ACOCQR_03020 [bacterium]